MSDHLKHILTSQFQAALAMHRECLVKCPPLHWDSTIGKYPFWHVSYHTLMFVDCYLARSNESFVLRPEFFPAGRAELDEEYPSRRFTQPELLAYADILHHPQLRDTIASETAETLQGPSGFSHLPFTRAELHLYNIRHLQHHTGQLAVFLRRLGVSTGWVKAGW
ncbi:hypothetical protein PHYC_00379 [Phycisphaerales bacterium]|nr:hypothetical protein PHYC_00379 [Phycisphaerales bacterium]